jgi:small-conductance mechanosensitive channel
MAAMTKLIWPAIASAVAVVAALALRAILLSTMRRWSPREGGVQVFVDALRLPSLLWCVVVGLYVGIDAATEVSGFSTRFRHELSLVLQSAVILSATFTAAGVVGTLIGRVSQRQSFGGPVTGLAQAAARATVLVLGLLTLALHLGVQIMPVITALGVGGLAVALALKDTLANLFAGIHLLADRPIRVGDYVKLGGADAIEGYVIDVGWRSTRIRLLQHSVVIVPNQTVANSTIVNYDLPEPHIRIDTRVSVGYGEDPARIEGLLLDVAGKALSEVPGLMGEPAPWVRFTPGFGANSLDFTLFCHVVQFVDQFPVQHELRKRIFARFRAEGVGMPVPTQTVPVVPPAGGAALPR